MPPERWGPSRGLRVLAAAQMIAYAGPGCVVMWFFFPHALLVPAMAVFAAMCLGVLVLPYQVTLDPGRAELAIRIGFWTRHVPLAEVARVDESERLAAVLLYRAWHSRRVASQPG